MIRVVMVDDHPIMHLGVANIVAASPDIELVSAVTRIEDLPQFEDAPDVLLLDLQLHSALEGLAGVRHVVDSGFRVLIVTAADTAMENVADAMAAGAQGYLTKDAKANEYAMAIRSVAAGRGYLAARLAAFAQRHSVALPAGNPNRFTKRESEVAGLIIEGYSNAEMAQLLDVSERTVDGHVENIKQKLCESRRVRVAMKLKELGYVPPPNRRWGSAG